MLQGLSANTSLDSENNSAIIRGDPLPFEVALCWGAGSVEKSENSGEREINGGRGGRGLVVEINL